MIFSTFEYSLGFISIILIITIIVLIYYKNNDDDENNNDDRNNDTYLKINMNNMNNDNIEHFYFESPYTQSNIDAIVLNNSRLSNLINEINNNSNNDPSVNMKIKKKDIDLKLQNKISNKIQETTNDIIDTVNTSNVIISNNIQTLTDQITDLENIIERLHLKSIIKPNYAKIKSLNNGAEITLSQTPNSFYLDPGSGVNTAAYMVNLNDGCLSVGATDYDVYNCNEANSKHLFKMEHVINESGYQKNIDKTVPFNNNDLSTINYPFVLMRSVNNKNCLTNQNGNITVQPCDTLTAQRWLPV